LPNAELGDRKSVGDMRPLVFKGSGFLAGIMGLDRRVRVERAGAAGLRLRDLIGDRPESVSTSSLLSSDTSTRRWRRAADRVLGPA
jgi:hypothetical protein